MASEFPWSDGVGSSIEGPPLPFIIWVMVLKQSSVLRRSDVLVTSVKGSLTSQVSESNLEFDS